MILQAISNQTDDDVPAGITRVLLAPPLGIKFDGDAEVGFYVTTVRPGSNAEKTGTVAVGMKFVTVNGVPTSSMREKKQLTQEIKGVTGTATIDFCTDQLGFAQWEQKKAMLAEQAQGIGRGGGSRMSIALDPRESSDGRAPIWLHGFIEQKTMKKMMKGKETGSFFVSEQSKDATAYMLCVTFKKKPELVPINRSGPKTWIVNKKLTLTDKDHNGIPAIVDQLINSRLQPKDWKYSLETPVPVPSEDGIRPKQSFGGGGGTNPILDAARRARGAPSSLGGISESAESDWEKEQRTNAEQQQQRRTAATPVVNLQQPIAPPVVVAQPPPPPPMQQVSVPAPPRQRGPVQAVLTDSDGNSAVPSGVRSAEPEPVIDHVHDGGGGVGDFVADTSGCNKKTKASAAAGKCLVIVTTHNSKFNCDACDVKGKRRIPKGTAMRGCRECDFDMCLHCWKTFNPPQYEIDMHEQGIRSKPGHDCVKGECLLPLKTFDEDFNCDLHDPDGLEPIPKGTRMWGCRHCDFDWCATCYRAEYPKKYVKDLKQLGEYKAIPHDAEKGECLKLLFTDDDKFNCDKHDPKGREKIPKGTMMRGCRKCDFDWCMRCYKQHYPVQYEKDMDTEGARSGAHGHGPAEKWACLEAFLTDKPKTNCDKHDRPGREKIPLGSRMWGCRQCDWDCCVVRPPPLRGGCVLLGRWSVDRVLYYKDVL